PDATPAHHARERRRIDCGPGAGVVAERLRQALAVAAGGVSLPVRPDPDPGDDRRSAGAVHLRDLLSHDASPADDLRIFVTRRCLTTTARCSLARRARLRSRRIGRVLAAA